MDFDELFGPKPIVIDLKAKDRWEAIDELVSHLVASKRIKSEHREAIGVAIKKRETAMSTAIGFGIGIPHATTDLVGEVVWAVGRSRKGIQFDAIDSQPVDLVMLFLMPQGQFQKQLNTLANIAKLLQNAEFRDELRRRFL
jgi:mannitol/fructose-specific phosphotransferase system IIA component (Ntr-type)